MILWELATGFLGGIVLVLLFYVHKVVGMLEQLMIEKEAELRDLKHRHTELLLDTRTRAQTWNDKMWAMLKARDEPRT